MDSKWTLPAALAGVLMSTAALADVGPYIGATIGHNQVETEFSDINFDFDESDTGWSAFGGIRLTNSFGIEASYNEFGGFSTINDFGSTRTEIDAELTGWDVFGVLTADLGPIDIFGKAGVVFWDAETTARILPPVGPGFFVDADDDGNDFAFGFGAEVAITPEIAFRGEYEWFDIEDTEQVSFISLGLTVKF